MVPWRSTEEGYVTPEVLDWYGRFAEGRPGVLVVEATGVRDVASGPLLRISKDRFIPGLKRLVDLVHRRSQGETRLLIQIIDFLTIRRRPEPQRYFERYLAVERRHREALAGFAGNSNLLTMEPTEFRARLFDLGEDAWRATLSARELQDLEMGYRERVTDTHLPHIAELPDVLPGAFADAADRARAAGFDGVELHYAHAYTMAGFLSRLNDRDDGYGGSLPGRLRAPLEVFDAVRRRVGEDYCVGMRFLGDEVIEGGSRISDAVQYGVAFARAGADFLSISKGGKFEDARQPRVGRAAYPYTGVSGLECMPTVRIDDPGPFSRNVHLARAIRHAVRGAGLRTPVVTAGGICSFTQAEGILKRGEADFIGAARQSLADPDWWIKMRRGQGDAIRRCIFTNYCEGLDQSHKEVTCQLWDREIQEGESPSLAADGRRRLVAPSWDSDQP